MRPSPSPLPLLRLVAIVMALLAAAVASTLMWQRFFSQPTVDDRYGPVEFQGRLLNGLQTLAASIQPGLDTEGAQICPPKADQSAHLEQAQLRCSLVALNVKLATAIKPQHISSDLIDDPSDEDLRDALKWVNRNASDGEHALALLRNPEQAAAQTSTPDPFRLPGCFYAAASNRSMPGTSACPERATVGDAALPHAQSLLSPVSQYRAATRGDSPNTLQWEPTPGMRTAFAQGRHVTAGWNAQIQNLAQTMAACYAGDKAACQDCPWCNTNRANLMFESARARAIGILVVDVRTGVIDAAASAYTPCYAAQQRGEGAPPGCPLFPSMGGDNQARPFRLGNQAILQTAMPGSQVKIPVALGLMRAGLTPKEAASLPSILTRSATEELIDLALCKEQDFLPSCAKRRLGEIRDVASAMGWQSKTDVLALGQVEDLSAPQFAARLMQLPGDKPLEFRNLDQESMRECGRKPVTQRWRNCHGADLINVVAELFGQGNSLASPVGVANGLLQLGAAGNGMATSSRAHLLGAAQDRAGRTQRIETGAPLAFDPASASPLFTGLTRTHVEGTAHSACLAARVAVKPTAWAIPCSSQSVRDQDSSATIRIASKTATPVFSADRYTLPQWRASCVQIAGELASLRKGSQRQYHLRNEMAKCSMSPIKWYSMLVGSPSSKTWDKALVVIAERNWYATTQRVDSAFDKTDANVAAEVGLAFANALYVKGGPERQSEQASGNH